MAKKVPHAREPIAIHFPDGVTDDDYLALAAAIRAVADMCPAHNEMSIDEGLDDAYDQVDPFGPTRARMAEERGESV